MHTIESENMYHIDQDFFMSKIGQIPSDAEFSKFGLYENETRMLCNSRHDIVFEISQITQVARPMYGMDIEKLWKRLNIAIKYVHDHKESIFIPKLEWNSLRITGFSDAAFAHNVELSSQLGRKVSCLKKIITLYQSLTCHKSHDALHVP